jgi:hypothetical protein
MIVHRFVESSIGDTARCAVCKNGSLHPIHQTAPTERNIEFAVSAHRMNRGGVYRTTLYGCTNMNMLDLEAARCFRAGVEWAVKWFAEREKNSSPLR